MVITDVQAIAIRAPSPVGQTYWGSKTWAKEPKTSAIVHDIESRNFAGTEYPPRWRMQAVYSETIDTTIIKISTDTGLVGYGEAKAPVAPEVCREIVNRLLRPVVMGADPFEVNVLWERMYSLMRLRGHTTGFYLEAISGVDIALWDLAGKAVGMPIHKLLGGRFRDWIKIYASGLPGLRNAADTNGADELKRSATDLAEQGFGAVKLGAGFGLEADVKSVDTVREAVGSEFLILSDAAGNYDVSQAISVGHALESLHVGWLEAPLPPEHVDGYAQVAQALTIPVTSDLIVGRHVAHHYLSQNALDVIQPDVCRAGGISECRRIADLADVHGVAFAPHVSIGSAIQFAATAQLAAAVPNLMIGEFWIGENPIGDAVLEDPLVRAGTYLLVPDGPGLGIAIKEDSLFRYAVK